MLPCFALLIFPLKQTFRYTSLHSDWAYLQISACNYMHICVLVCVLLFCIVTVTLRTFLVDFLLSCCWYFVDVALHTLRRPYNVHTTHTFVYADFLPYYKFVVRCVYWENCFWLASCIVDISYNTPTHQHPHTHTHKSVTACRQLNNLLYLHAHWQDEDFAVVVNIIIFGCVGKHTRIWSNKWRLRHLKMG